MLAEDTMRLDRFCGHEVYRVVRTGVYVRLPEEDDPRVMLNVEFHCGAVVDIDVPEEEGDGSLKPTVEIWIPIPSTNLSPLVGTSLEVHPSVKDNEDGMWNRLHVYESGDLREINVTFVAIDDGRCHVALTAKTGDPNHYDGSKPETTISLDGWFPMDELETATE